MSAVTANAAWDTLFSAARAVREKAYAPYSHFFVGAAGLLDDGSVVSGCNVENASLGLTVCAERHVVAAAVQAGRPRLQLLALVADAPAPVAPCGACRQVLSEFCEPTLVIRSRTIGAVGSNGPSPQETTFTLAELLPHAFKPDVLHSHSR